MAIDDDFLDIDGEYSDLMDSVSDETDDVDKVYDADEAYSAFDAGNLDEATADFRIPRVKIPVAEETAEREEAGGKEDSLTCFSADTAESAAEQTAEPEPSPPAMTEEEYKSQRNAVIRKLRKENSDNILLLFVFEVIAAVIALIFKSFLPPFIFLSVVALILVFIPSDGNYKGYSSMLSKLKNDYLESLGDVERARFEKRKRRKKAATAAAVISVILVIIAIPVAVSAMKAHKTDETYFAAARLAFDGKYEEALAAAKEFEKEDFYKNVNYKDTQALISYCEAVLNYENGRIVDAYYDIDDVSFRYLPDSMLETFESFKRTVCSEYSDIEQNYYNYLFSLGRFRVPYVGMPESEIGDSSLGKPSGNVRHEYEGTGDERRVANIYDFVRDGKTVFTAKCVGKRVVEVWGDGDPPETTTRGVPPTTRTPSTRIPSTTRKRTQTTQEDPYNVNDYSSEEDFYDDNYDDFLDYYDAEDYYREHHE